MFDIGFPELALGSLVALRGVGPERLPSALRTLGLWLGRIRRGFNAVKSEFEREIGMDDVRRQLHNEQIMEEVKKIQQETQEFTNEIAGTSSGLAPGELADHPDLSTDPGPTTTANTAEENIASDVNPTQMEILPSKETQKSEKDRKVGKENESGG